MGINDNVAFVIVAVIASFTIITAMILRRIGRVKD